MRRRRGRAAAPGGPAGKPDGSAARSEFVLYQAADGSPRVEVRIAGDSAWLSLVQLSVLFQRDKSVISRHLKNIFEEGELVRAATVAIHATVQHEGARAVEREIEFYNLDAILAVGYRVRSQRGTTFRQWATELLRGYIVKGFALDDARLRETRGAGYFEELLARIRDIRSSEKVFWRKVLDIYATSVDYDPGDAASELFFKTVQNRMHWAAHGHTAAEVIAQRADAAKEHMGLTSWSGSRPRRVDIAVAKNYLSPEELEALNRIVSAYLEFAELQALSRRPMHMRDWIARLDDFLRAGDRDILSHAGTISHEVALLKAEMEFAEYERRTLGQPSSAELDFEKASRKVAEILPSPGKRHR